jgi:hypothetical protein
MDPRTSNQIVPRIRACVCVSDYVCSATTDIERVRVEDPISRTGYKWERRQWNQSRYDFIAEEHAEEKRKVQSYIGRYMRNAKQYLDFVCKGSIE